VEALPVADDSFDIVLCTQVLEHAEDPAVAVRELHRVTKPGGRVLASTHGVQVFHPNPNDYWRWTHTGFQRLFDLNRQRSDLSVEWWGGSVRPGAGTAEGLALLVGRFLHLLAKRANVAAAARPLVAAINAGAAALDARVPILREPVPGALFANFHVTAVKT